MILPPFLGISSNYDEDQIKEAIISYLSLDTATFELASNFLSVTFVSLDTSTFDLPHDTASVTYVNADVATNSAPSNVKILGTSLQIKNPNTIANTRLKYFIGVTNEASASL